MESERKMGLTSAKKKHAKKGKRIEIVPTSEINKLAGEDAVLLRKKFIS